MRIVFMGTPEFAVESLRKLVENKQQVVAVITSPDKPAGRGRKLSFSAVKEYALDQNIPVLQPTNLKSTAFLEELASFKADVQVVVAFRMLPEVVWAMPPKGTFNLHASLLPQYRGAAPINWAIINGESKTGVTTFFIEKEIDTGKIILQKEVGISDSMTAGELHDQLMVLGSELVLETVIAIKDNTVKSKDQKLEESLKMAPKLFKEDMEINWGLTSEACFNFIRGLSPYPAAFTQLTGKQIKIFKTTPRPAFNKEFEIEPGVSSDGKTFLQFATLNGALEIEELQMEGKKRMPIQDFLRGQKL